MHSESADLLGRGSALLPYFQCSNVEPWWWKGKPKGFGSLPAPRSGYGTTIMVSFCSFTHLRIPRLPPKFNQFFIVLPRTPPQNFIPVRSFLSNVVHRQTNQCYQKHNLLCQGGNYTKNSVSTDLHGQGRIITPVLLSVSINKVCSSLTICINECGPWWWMADPKASGSLPAPPSSHATTIMVLFHLLILEDPDHHQNLISSS